MQVLAAKLQARCNNNRVCKNILYRIHSLLIKTIRIRIFRKHPRKLEIKNAAISSNAQKSRVSPINKKRFAFFVSRLRRRRYFRRAFYHNSLKIAEAQKSFAFEGDAIRAHFAHGSINQSRTFEACSIFPSLIIINKYPADRMRAPERTLFYAFRTVSAFSFFYANFFALRFFTY